MTFMDFEFSVRKRTFRLHIPRMLVIFFAILVLGLWLFNTPDGLLGKADAIGYAICHRIDMRSFHLGDRTLPLCSRCSGTYLGVILSLLYFTTFKRKASFFPPRKILLILGLFILIYAVDGLNSYFSLISNSLRIYEPNNIFRITTGMLFGISLTSVVYPSFNQSLWHETDNIPPLQTIKQLGILVFLGIILVLLVVSENVFILYLVALITSLGVLILLTMIYTMILLILTRREGLATSWKELMLPAIGGFSLAILQIGLIDLARYLLMGTWEGFNFL